MTVALLLLSAGGILVLSGLRGQSIGETIRGELGGLANASTGFARVFDVAAFREREAPAADGPTMIPASFGSAAGGASAMADAAAAIGRRNGLREVSRLRPGATTTSGSVSDHSENSARRAATDLSNGSSPTQEMDRTVEEIAGSHGARVNGSRPVVKTIVRDGVRIQLLYRTRVGGNHNNHVHAGFRAV